MNSKSVKEGGKHNMYSKSKRFIASFLAVLMAVCMLPVDMFGAVGVVNAAGEITATIDNEGDTPVTANQEVNSGTQVKLTVASSVTEDITHIIWSFDSSETFTSIDETAFSNMDKKATISAGGSTNVEITGTGGTNVTLVAAIVNYDSTNSTVDTVATETFTFKIAQTDLKDATVTFNPTSMTAGDNIPKVIVTAGGQTVNADEYDISYNDGTTNYTSAADLKTALASITAETTVTVTVTAKGSSTAYKGTNTGTFTVALADDGKTDLNTDATVTCDPVSITAGGSIPDVIVKVGTTTLTPDTDYTVVKYTVGNTDYATATELKAVTDVITAETTVTVTVTAKTDSITYKGSQTGTFKVTPADGGDVTGLKNLVLDMANVTLADYSSDYSVRGFTFLADSNNIMTVDTNGKKIDINGDGTKEEFTQRLKFGGLTTINEAGNVVKSIMFETKKAATVSIVAMCSSGNKETKVDVDKLVVNADGSKELSIVKSFNNDDGLGGNGNSVSFCQVDLTEAGTYYIAAKQNSVNIYYISVTYEGVDEVYEPQTVTVTFNTNDGLEVAAQSVEVGSVCTEPATVKDKFVFDGWYDNAECTGEAYDFSTPVTAALTLYAKWTEDTGAKNLVLSMDSISAGSYAKEFTKNGFTVIAASSNTVAVTSAGSSYTDTDTGATYTQILKLNGSGNTSKRAIKFTTDKASTLTIIAAANGAGSRNLKLKKDSDSDKVLQASSSLDVFKVTESLEPETTGSDYYVYGDEAFNIYYISVVPDNQGSGDDEFTVTFKNGTETVAEETVTDGTLELSEVTEPTATGKTFKGWTTTSGSTTVDYAKDATMTVDGDTTLYAVWEVIKPVFDQEAAEGESDYTFPITTGTVTITSENDVYYVLSTEETKYAAFDTAGHDAAFYESTDNATPYTDAGIPITTDNTTIKAIAIAEDGSLSEVVTSCAYKLGSLAPLTGTINATLTPDGAITVGDNDVKVTLTYTVGTPNDAVATANDVKFLWTASTDPDVVPEFSDPATSTDTVSGTTYDDTTGIPISTDDDGTVYVKVLAYTEDTTGSVAKVATLSSTAEFEYTVNALVTPPAMPTAVVDWDDVTVTGSNVNVIGSAEVYFVSTDGAQMYYTTDGTDPNENSFSHDGYYDRFTVDETTTFKVIAIKDGQSSEIFTLTVTVLEYNNEGDEENWDNNYWDCDKEEITKANGGNIPKGLWIAGLDQEYGYSYNAGLKVTPDTSEAWGESDDEDHYCIRVYYHTHLLTYKTDYNVSYKNNVNAAKSTDAKAPTIVISGKGSYSGKVTKTFTINPYDIDYVDGDCIEYVLAKKNNKKQQIVPTLTDEGYDSAKGKWKTKKLKNKKDFDVVYYDAAEYYKVLDETEDDNKVQEELAKIAKTEVTTPGEYKVAANGKGNYTGSYTFNVTVRESTDKLASKLKVSVKNVKYDQTKADAADFKGFIPEFKVKDGKTELVAAIYDENGNITNEAAAQYGYRFSNNKVAGTGTLYIEPIVHKSTVTGDNGETTTTSTQAFYGDRYVSFKISGNSIKSAKVTYDGDLTYDYSYGIIDTSKISVSYKGTPLTPYKYDETTKKYVGDYYIGNVSNNGSAGKATVYIYGMNAYEGTLAKTFKIAACDISNATVTLAGVSGEEAKTLKAVFSKGGCYPEIKVTYTFTYSDNTTDTETLEEGVDYTVSYKNNKNYKKTPQIVIKGKGNYKGTKTESFTFEEKDLSDQTLTLSVPDVPLLTRAGKYGSKPVITDKGGIKTTNLAVKKDYTLEYYDVTPASTENAGGGDNDNSGDNSGSTTTALAEEGTENTTETTTTTGKPIDNINRFTATKDTVIRVVAKAVSGSGYKGSTFVEYKVREKDFNKVTVKINPQEYAGEAVLLKEDQITVTPKGGSALTLKTDKDSTEDGYCIESYTGNDKKGSAKVTLVGTGSYAGSKTVTFKITARKLEWAQLSDSVEKAAESITNVIKGLFN